MTTQRFAGVVLLLALTLTGQVRAQEDVSVQATRDAQAAAESWLAVVDSAHYAVSWSQAAAAFRAAVSQQTWDSTLGQVRTPLGAVQSRALLGAQYTTTLPNAPPGEYVVLQFRTVFAGRAEPAVETVVPMKERDGTWRVSGYFIR
jgi:hypothetical protein